MKKIFYFICLTVLLISCKKEKNGTIENVNPTIFNKKMQQETSLQLIDVRTPIEWKEGFIPNAININWQDKDFEVKVAQLDKEKAVYVYCKKGGRSSKAALKLSQMGFVQIYNLDGGYEKWLENNETNSSQ